MKILFHYMLTFMVTSEESVVSLIINFSIFILVISLFFWMFKKMFSLYLLSFSFTVRCIGMHFILFVLLRRVVFPLYPLQILESS